MNSVGLAGDGNFFHPLQQPLMNNFSGGCLQHGRLVDLRVRHEGIFSYKTMGLRDPTCGAIYIRRSHYFTTLPFVYNQITSEGAPVYVSLAIPADVPRRSRRVRFHSPLYSG